MKEIQLTGMQRYYIKYLRKEMGLLGSELSSQIGKGYAYISQLESGKIKKVPMETLEMILNILGVSLDEILGNNSKPKLECSGVVEVEKLINRFKEMEKQGALLSGNVNSKDLLIQIIGTIVVVANEDDK